MDLSSPLLCGAVITRATKDLKWAESDKVLKCIFIAGNEPFTQGPIDPFKACSDAIKKGITVNTINPGTLNFFNQPGLVFSNHPRVIQIGVKLDF